jgi:hypothetical protein
MDPHQLFLFWLMLVNPPELRITPMATLKPLPNDN